MASVVDSILNTIACNLVYVCLKQIVRFTITILELTTNDVTSYVVIIQYRRCHLSCSDRDNIKSLQLGNIVQTLEDIYDPTCSNNSPHVLMELSSREWRRIVDNNKTQCNGKFNLTRNIST